MKREHAVRFGWFGGISLLISGILYFAPLFNGRTVPVAHSVCSSELGSLAQAISSRAASICDQASIAWAAFWLFLIAGLLLAGLCVIAANRKVPAAAVPVPPAPADPWRVQ